MTRSRIIVAVLATSIIVLLLACTANALAMSNTGARPTMKVIVMVKAKGSVAIVVAKLKDQGATHIYRYHLIRAVAATISRATWNNLREDKNVARVVADRQSTLAGAAAAAGTSATSAASTNRADQPRGPSAQCPVEPALEPEALQLTHAQDAWKIKVNGQPVMGQGIRVGMLDSGVDADHPDLAGAIEAYRDFTGWGQQDEVGHGTGTASTIVAQGLPVFNPWTNTYMKVEGVAPRAKVLMAKEWTADASGYDSAYIRALEWLVDEKVDLISGGGHTPTLRTGGYAVATAVQAVIDKGITFLALTYNDGPGQGLWLSPGNLKDVLTVGAASANRLRAQIGSLTSGSAYRSGQVADFYDRGPNSVGDFKPDILGVGDDQWALGPTYPFWTSDQVGMQMFGGTSQATPTVAGNLALAMSAWKMLHPGKALPAPAYWKNLIASTATDLGFPALDNSTGLVNGEAAVKAVLGQGSSFLVSVAADPKNPQSWSVKARGGSKVSTSIRVKNTGQTTQHITMRPTMFVADESKTITRSFTLHAANDYGYSRAFRVPAGAEFVEARCVWSSDPQVSLQAILYDSAGNLLNCGRGDAGYGHLSLAQASLTGPVAQRPVVDTRPWRVAIAPFQYVYFPYTAYPPTEDQPAQVRIEFKHKATWQAVTLSRSTLTLAPGAAADVVAAVTAPAAAGTHFGGIVVSGDGCATTVPLAVHVPVDVTHGGVFSGAFTGSSKQASIGGEWRFYDFVVPPGTSSVQASVEFGASNLVNLYLVDPSGRVCDAQGGDLVMALDYGASGFLVDESAFELTAQQVVWDHPAPGKWQVMLWAGGFSGRDFAEPYEGRIVLNREPVAPASWTGTAAAGATVSRTFTVANGGPTDLSVFAEGQQVVKCVPQYAAVELLSFAGSLDPAGALQDWEFFWAPQGLRSATVDVACTSSGSLVDLDLWDPTFVVEDTSLATSTSGNSISIAEPMAGWWTVILMPAFDAAGSAVDFTGTVTGEAPVPMPGLESSATSDVPITAAAGGNNTITATFTVPADAKSGDCFTGRLRFYTVVDVNGVTSFGGDRLATVPVRITVK